MALLMVLAVGPAFAGWDEGVAAFTGGSWEKAAEEFQELVKQNPDGWRGHYMLGLSLELVGNKEEAQSHLRKAYDLNPNDLSLKISAELGAGHYKNALKTALAASQASPDDWQVSYYLGQAYSSNQQSAKARSAYERAAFLAKEAGIRWPAKMIKVALGRA